MHATTAAALLLLLLAPTLAPLPALAEPVPAAPAALPADSGGALPAPQAPVLPPALQAPVLPVAPLPGPRLPAPLPLVLDAPGAPATLTLGAQATILLVVRSEGLAGQGVEAPAERRVALRVQLPEEHAATLAPNPVVLPPGAAHGWAVLRLTPAVLGPLPLQVDAAWDLLPPDGPDPLLGNATLHLAPRVVKDSLAAEGLAAGPPDADLDLALAATLRSGALANESLAWRVEAEHVPVNGTGALRWLAAEGRGLASPGGAAWSAEVRARYGPGSYAFELVAAGPRLEEARARLRVDVPEVRADGGSANFTVEVEDHPTTLRLASDAVNEDTKAKAPGSAVITRVLVGDRNGLQDVRRVVVSYYREDAAGRVLVEARSIEGLGGGVERLVEDRFVTSPMKDGSYLAEVAAEGTGTPVVARRFTILDVLPEASLRFRNASLLPARAGALEATLEVRDRNFGTGPLDGSDVTELGTLRLTLYKGSTRVAEDGWALAAAAAEGPSPLDVDLAAEGSRSTRWTYRAGDGLGRLELPVVVRIPEGAAAGSYRLSVAAASTLASAPFEVQALPRVARVALGSAAPGGAIPFEVEIAAAAPEALAGAELRLPWGSVRASADDLVIVGGARMWRGEAPVPQPWDDDAPAEALAVADLGDGRVVLDPRGQPVNARAAPLVVANVPPVLAARLQVGGVDVGEEAWIHPHAADELRALAAAADANAAEAGLGDEVGPLEAEVRDWRGEHARFEVDGHFGPAEANLTVRPQGVEPGRYTLVLRARDDDGAVAERRLPVHVGTHFKLVLAAPGDGLRLERQDDGSLAAEVRLTNKGNAPAGSVAVLAEGLPPGAQAEVRITLANGTALTLPLAAGFARFQAQRLLEPCEGATLRLVVRAGDGVPAGRFAGRLVVAGEAA